MFCTEKERKTCNVEKMGCEGCYYNNEDIEILEMDLDDIVEYLTKQVSFEYGQIIGRAIKNIIERVKQLEIIQEDYMNFVGSLPENYIKRSKVKEKIEELERDIEDYLKTDNSGRFTRENCRMTDEVNILQELLKE